MTTTTINVASNKAQKEQTEAAIEGNFLRNKTATTFNAGTRVERIDGGKSYVGMTGEVVETKGEQVRVYWDKTAIESRKQKRTWIAAKSLKVISPAFNAPAATAKKGTPKKGTAAPVTREPRAKKEGLRKPQVRILAALAKAKTPLTRNEIAEKATCDKAWLNSWIGSKNPEIRAKNDKAEFPCLLTLKLVKDNEDEEKGTVYIITPAGKAALAAASK
jgi:hypothetical protein